MQFTWSTYQRETDQRERTEMRLTLWTAATSVAKKRDRWKQLISGDSIPDPTGGQGTEDAPKSSNR